MINPLRLKNGDIAYYNGYPGIVLVVGSVRFFIFINPEGDATGSEKLDAADASQLDLVCSKEIAAAKYAGSLPVIFDE